MLPGAVSNYGPHGRSSLSTIINEDAAVGEEREKISLQSLRFSSRSFPLSFPLSLSLFVHMHTRVGHVALRTSMHRGVRSRTVCK